VSDCSWVWHSVFFFYLSFPILNQLYFFFRYLTDKFFSFPQSSFTSLFNSWVLLLFSTINIYKFVSRMPEGQSNWWFTTFRQWNAYQWIIITTWFENLYKSQVYFLYIHHNFEFIFINPMLWCYKVCGNS